ncbi:retrovirus-related pol polyprotein from transposon TNT 1-94 [Tanacetum coccineum]
MSMSTSYINPGESSYDSLRLSQAQIIWGMYHKTNVDYAFLLWEDCTYQVENKNTKKVNVMYYPRFTKLMVNFFMSKDPSISQRNKIYWHYAKDDPMFTTINVISRREDTQLYGTILPKELTNEDIQNSESYKEYYAIALGEVPPKTKASVHKKKADSDTTPKENPPTDPKGKRVKQTGKMTGSRKEKQPTIGLETLSDIALTKTEQLKIAIKRSRIQTYSSQASGSGINEGAGDKPEVPNVPEHQSNSEEESWTFSDDDDDEDDDANKDLDAHDDDDDDDATETDDDGDNITHPKLSTFSTDDQEEQDDEEEQEDDDEDEEDIYDQLVRTPADYQTSDESEKQKDDDRVKNGEEDKEGDVTNVALEGGDVDTTKADTTEDTKDAHVTLTTATPVVQQQSSSVSDPVSKFISPTMDEGIDSILNPRTESTTLVNVPISVATETPATTTTIHPPLFLVTQSSQQTPVTTTIITYPSTTQPLIPKFASLFSFNQRVTVLESDLSKLKQSNPFSEAISSILGITIIKDQVKTQTSKIKSKVKKYVTESLGAEVLIRSTNQPQTSYGIASSLSELELKRILMDKMEENKSIDRSHVHKNLYNALVEAYNTDKDLLSSYGDVIIIPTTRDDKYKDEEPSTGSNRGTKRQRPGKEAESSKEPTRKESRITSSLKGASRSQPTNLNETTHLEFIIGDDDVIPAREVQDVRQWHPPTSLTPDHEWHLTKNVFDLPPQHWITDLAQTAGTQSSFDDAAELEYHLEEVFKATNEQLDWNNPEGTSYPHNLSKPLPLIPNVRGRLIIPFDHFINNDLEYLKGGSSSRKHTTSITKTKAADYGKLTNLSLDDRYALNVALRMYTRRIVIQECVEDLQLAMDYLPKRRWSPQDKRRARVMISAIDRKLRDRRLMRRFYTSAGNLIKEILLKLNLPDHSILKDGGEARRERCAAERRVSSTLPRVRVGDGRMERVKNISTKHMNADTKPEIILSQRPSVRHIFNNLNQTSTAKEIWDNVEMLMQGSGKTLQQRKEDLFDEYERFRAIGNESIHDYFVRFHKLVNDMKITQLNIPTHQMNTKFVNNLPAYWGKYVTNVKQNMDISTTPYVQIYTHLKAYEPHAKKTLKKQEQSTSIVDPLAYVAHTTSAPALSSPSTPSPQPTAQSPNDALMATMTQIANLLSGFQKQFPPTNNQLRTSSNSRTHAMVHDGHIVTEPIQRKAPGNVGNTGARGKKVICYNCRGEGHVARQCPEPKRKMDSQYFKDKALLMEAKEKGDVLDAEAEAFLADVECTAPYDQPQALTTTNMFQANHEDAYDSDVDEGPNAAVAFMANLSSTSATNNPVNEVHSNDNQIFDNVDYQLSQEMHQEEHLDSDAETEIDDNTIPYHQYLLDTEAQNVPTEVSADTSDKVSMIAILTDLQTQLDGHAKVNQEKCLEIETLKNELLQCKQEICRLDTHKVKLDLENKVRQEQALVIQRNKRNAELVQENDLLKSTLSGKEKSIAFLQSEKEKILSEKKDLADSYLDEIVCLKNANKVARDMLQRFNMPTQTIPMLSKKPKKATNDLHKDILGTRNPGLGYMAKRAQPVLYDADTLLHPAHHPVRIWDSEDVLVHQVVSMKKMSEKPGHVRPANGFYDKLNAMMFVPQKELSQEQAYWLSANEIASNASNPATPVTPFVHNRPPPSQVLFHFQQSMKRFVLDNKNWTLEKKNLFIKNDCLIVECLEKDICSIVLTSDIVVPPSSNCLCEDLRSACDREHTKVLELEAEVLKQQKE